MPGNRRLFFGLYPPEDVRQRLVELQNAWTRRGSRHHPRDLHVTLLFIGMSDRQVCFEEAAATIRQPPFELVLDIVDYWRRPKILLAGARVTPEPLAGLVDALNGRVAACDYTPDERPYRPHVTLARRSVPVEQASIEPILWPVDEFRLFWSRDGIGMPRYQTLGQWKLVGETADADHRPGSSC